jgi:hypothetical protein
MKRRVTDEMYARIPALLEEGKSTADIAALYGVATCSLKVMCSKRQISLRRGGPRPPRTKLVVSHDTMRALHEAAVAMGRKTDQLATDLLDRIASDNLYRAVLDEEAA